MRELSLHILDIIQNSLEAGASQLELVIRECSESDRLTIEIRDNGRGMDVALAQAVLDPFVTTRTTRKVGLGLPLFQAAARRCQGDLVIESSLGLGTTVRVDFQLSHIDRAPLGDMINTLLVVISGNPELNLVYTHSVNGRTFTLDTRKLREQLDDVSLSHLLVLDWLRGYLNESLDQLYGGED